MDGMADALVLSESSGEATKASEGERPKKSRGKKISRVAVASDESEPEEDEHQGKPKEETKKRGKSQRRKEKEKCRGALVKQLKEKTRTSEVSKLGVFRKLLSVYVVIADCHFLCLSLRSPFYPSLSMTVVVCWVIVTCLMLSWRRTRKRSPWTPSELL